MGVPTGIHGTTERACGAEEGEDGGQGATMVLVVSWWSEHVEEWVERKRG